MSALPVSTLVPGLLVSLKTSVRGGVSYKKEDIEKTAEHARWITDKDIADPEEHDRATKVRNRCSSMVRGVCSLSSFGLLCRQDNAWKLEDAMAEARELARQFNSTSRYTKISINVIVGRVADNDVEATRAIRQEVADLIETMQAGIAGLDVEKVRDAANRAKSVGKMLSPAAQKDVDAAIDAARTIAKAIVKAGETAAEAIDANVLATLVRARTEFLDVPDAGLAVAAVEPVAPDGLSRGLDMEPDSAVPEPPASTPAIDLAWWDEPSKGE